MRLKSLLVATGLAVVAAPANAALMQATVTGDFNDNPYWQSWRTEFIFETDLGTLTSGPSGARLVWDATGGTPSPLASYYEQLNPRTRPTALTERPLPSVYYATFTNFTHFEIVYDTSNFYFFVDGPGGSHTVGFQRNVDFTGPFDLEGPANFSSSVGSYNFSSGIGSGKNYAGLPHTHAVRITAVPEPTTWALIVMGFGAAGHQRRRRQRVSACTNVSA